ncbi:LOW QUALITY PROTEIN: DEAD-box ATP-dependent RNA helicase 28 [Arachis duranensis]|uniref:LOW QUALITY PROTEIN: DEAD-box ATP-dependent RNA helicase 28 n=1 Tax=Arachis duranensis TaxID=130453 RepID=A0A6P4CML1_ARADU|nr:LOW QUALITY PROTEIN: DEAD-box ATP-dependent RNA helicase 28 [Arachis duranensis]
MFPFLFEPQSDEEIEHSEEEEASEPESEPGSEPEESEGEEEEDEQEASRISKEKKKKKTQSPWDFAKYTESVAEEHARRSTTSVDEKISKALKQRSTPLAVPSQNNDVDDSSDSEPDKQEDYRPDEEDEEEGNAADSKSFFAPSDGASFHADSFLQLHLSRPLLRACEALGYAKPTPIQAACIPLALNGRDICGSAITGSGKTAAFALPTLERLLFRPKRMHAIRVLILTPTRELAVQVHSMIEKLAQFTDIRCCLVVGGLSTKVQEAALRSMPDIVVATPGRMIDHLRNSMSVDLDDLAVLILDEADRLLELGFSAEIHELVRMCPKKRQTMLFSATMTEEVDDLIKLSLTKPVRLSADPSPSTSVLYTMVVGSICHIHAPVEYILFPLILIMQIINLSCETHFKVVRIRRLREANQEAVLLAMCSKTFTSKVIIFSGTKQAAHRLKIIFGLAGLKAAELHGNLTQAQRLEALEQFRKQEVDFLIATDVAARGLDIIGVQTVINYACPRDLTSYVHRVGRTARAGREGCAVTFVTDNDRSLLKAIAKRAGSKLKSRIVAEQSIHKWSHIIEQLEDQIAEVLEEEREERALRKAEMEATKAENLIAHKEEIFSRPKRTWFVTETEKKVAAKAAKVKFLVIVNNDKSSGKVISAQEAEDLKMKEKRKREREKNLPRKKRRKLEAAREMLEDEGDDDKPEAKGANKKEKGGLSLVDVAYRRAKAVKAVKKAMDSGKIVKKNKKNTNRPSHKSSSRTQEMQELFQADMKDKKPKRRGAGAGKKSKSSFKSKSRYKRR